MANQTIYPYGTGGSLPSSIGIINDLTTGGADKALSAEQGKVLNTTILGLEDITVQQESYVSAGAFGYWSNKWQQSSHSGVFIPIFGAPKIKVQTATGKAFRGLFCFYTVQVGNSSVSVSTVDNTIMTLAANGSAEYDVPSDGAFLWCNINANDNTAAPTVTLLGVESSSGIKSIAESAYGELNGSSTTVQISPTTFIKAGGFGFWGGRWHASNTHYGGFIPVEGKISVDITARTSGSFWGVFCTDTTQADNSAISISTIDNTGKSLAAGSSATYTVPADAKYLWFNVNVNDGRETPSAFESNQSSGLIGRVNTVETEVADLEETIADIQEYVAFGTDYDWMLSNNVQVFHTTDRNKTVFHNSSGHWLVDGIKCCKNPVVYYDCPDMSIILVNDKIYGYSSGNYGQIFRSDNFAKWEKLNSRIIPYSSYTKYWAPDANVIDGKIVIYFSCDNKLVVATSNDPAPENGFTEEAVYNYNKIDYCYYDGVLFYGSGTIYYREMTDYKTPSSTEVATNMNGEGLMIWHHGDYYYAFTSTLSSQSYQYDIRVYRSATLQNNTWEYGGVILKTDSEVMLCGPGHISEIFQDNDGHYFAMMQVHIYDSGWSFRPTSIQELIVNNSGWPQFVDYQGNITTEPQLLSRAPAMPITIEK